MLTPSTWPLLQHYPWCRSALEAQQPCSRRMTYREMGKAPNAIFSM